MTETVIITRAANGTAQVAGGQGIPVTVTLDGKIDISGHEQCVWQTGMGQTKLHNSGKVRGRSKGAKVPKMLGYMHPSKNSPVLFAVSALDVDAHTLTINKQGFVKGGNHCF